MNKDYKQALGECLSKCPPECKTPVELIEYGFRHGHMTGFDSGYRKGSEAESAAVDHRRLSVAIAAMQGLLAAGWLAEHGDTAAEAVRQADALLAKLSVK